MFNSRLSQVLFILTLFVLNVGLTYSNQALADKYKGKSKDRVYTLSDVKGRYAFSFSGEILNVGSVAAVGYIVSEGNGHISEAARTITIPALGVVATETFTCTYTIKKIGKGSATCTLDETQVEETFDYVVEENGEGWRLVGTTPGVAIVGVGHR